MTGATNSLHIARFIMQQLTVQGMSAGSLIGQHYHSCNSLPVNRGATHQLGTLELPGVCGRICGDAAGEPIDGHSTCTLATVSL